MVVESITAARTAHAAAALDCRERTSAAITRARAEHSNFVLFRANSVLPRGQLVA